MLKTWSIFFGLLLLFIFFTTSQLIINPPVWPDEAYYSDIALNIIKSGRIGTDLFGNIIHGISNHFYWYPPGLFLLYALQIKIFGLSIINQRLLAVFIASLFLIIFFLLTKELLVLENGKEEKRKIIFFIPVLLLIIDQYFLIASRISRPEIYVMFFAMLANLILLKADKKPIHKNLLFFISGLVLSAVLLIHFVALIYIIPVFVYLIFKFRLTLFFQKFFYLFILGLFSLISIWFIKIFQDYSYLIDQVKLQSQFRFLLDWTFQKEFLEGDLAKKIIIISYILWSFLLIIYCVYSIKKNKSYYLVLICLGLIFSWVYMWLAKLGWYTSLIIPFIYLTIFFYINRLSKLKDGLVKRVGLISIFISICLFIGINFYNYASLLKDPSKKFDYDFFTKKLLEIIPDNKSVYLASFPSAYYSFKERRHNSLYQSPAVEEMDFIEYIKVLNNSDYVVYNTNLSELYFGRFFLRYLDLNRQYIKFLEIGGYKVSVIKLRSQKARITPKVI